MNRSLAPAAVLLVALSAHASLIAQNVPAAQPLPKDPAALLKLASQVNGLQGDNLQPWHARATWQLSAGRGTPAMQGTFEEWWQAEKRWKAIWTSPAFRRIQVATEQGTSASGDAQWPDPVLSLINQLVQSPLPESASVATMKLSQQRAKTGGVSLRCILRHPDAASRPSLDGGSLWLIVGYCFAHDSPAVRIEQGQELQIVFNSLAVFQGRYVAQDVRIARTGLPELKIHVDSLETTKSLGDAAFAPSSTQ